MNKNIRYRFFMIDTFGIKLEKKRRRTTNALSRLFLIFDTVY